jgi:hypothetical protein
MEPDSKTVMPVDVSTRAGIRPLGLIFKNQSDYIVSLWITGKYFLFVLLLREVFDVIFQTQFFH